MISMFKRYLIMIFAALFVLAGCTSSPRQSGVASEQAAAPTAESSATRLQEDARLGTRWGEDVTSPVVGVEAERLYRTPDKVAAVYYSAERVKSGASSLPLSAVEMRIQNARGKDMKIGRDSKGNAVLAGIEGERYQLYFFNSSFSTTYEIVATVDGLDVLSGQAGSLQNRGYLIRPRSSLTIEGFRKSDSAVAAFRFAKPDASYAAHSLAGDENNVGVIGAAVFSIAPAALPDCQPQAFPASNGYAPPPCRK